MGNEQENKEVPTDFNDFDPWAAAIFKRNGTPTTGEEIVKSGEKAVKAEKTDEKKAAVRRGATKKDDGVQHPEVKPESDTDVNRD